jgi:large conductance mechanosensitive channel
MQTIFDFLIVAVAIFAMVKAINTMKKKEEPAPAATPEVSSTDKLLIEIRDALKKR